MHFRCRLLAACWLFGIAAGSGELAAQQAIQITKEQLVGTWKLVSKAGAAMSASDPNPSRT